MKRETLSIAVMMLAGAMLLSMPSEGVAGPHECSDGSYNRIVRYKNEVQPWYLWQGVQDGGRRTALFEGHNAWTVTRNNCGFADQDRFRFDYGGTTVLKYGLGDGANVTDIGDTGQTSCGSAAAGCTAISLGEIGRINEADSRISGSWANNHANGGIQGVMAHEAGHALGLHHVGCDSFGCHDNLTMWVAAPPNPSTLDTLGRGDRDGLLALGY